MDARRTIFDLLDLPIGNLAVKSIDTQRWGGEVIVEMIYRHLPEEKAFTVRFTGVRNIQWIIMKMDVASDAEAQLLTHDLGQGDYQRTARFATVVAEFTISYLGSAIEVVVKK